MIVVPRLLIRNPAIPSQRRVVRSLGSNAEPPKGCVCGALAWYLCCIVLPLSKSRKIRRLSDALVGIGVGSSA
jgi:hypothetical protein